MFDKEMYPSVEHAYMAAKCKQSKPLSELLINNKITYFLINDLMKTRGKNISVNEENIDKIFTNKNIDSGSIKLITNIISNQISLREDWDDVQVKIMINLLLQKWRNNDYYRDILLKTNEKELIEGTTWEDTYWGVDAKTGKGNNFLGRILMEIRLLIKNEEPL